MCAEAVFVDFASCNGESLWPLTLNFHGKTVQMLCGEIVQAKALRVTIDIITETGFGGLGLLSNSPALSLVNLLSLAGCHVCIDLIGLCFLEVLKCG